MLNTVRVLSALCYSFARKLLASGSLARSFHNRLLAIFFFLLAVCANAQEETPFFSDYKNIIGIYHINGFDWFFDPADGIVFQYNPSKRIFQTFLSSIGPSGFRESSDVHIQGNKLILHATDSHHKHIGEFSYYEFFNYYFDFSQKRFGKDSTMEKTNQYENRLDNMTSGTGIRHKLGYAIQTLEDRADRPESITRGTISGFLVPDSNGKTSFYPFPKTKSKDFYQWRPEHPQNSFFPDIWENIGVTQRVGNQIWFGITFYEGENADGVGGFGYFDLATRKYSVFRPKILRNYSIEAMHVEWPNMWLSTTGHYELGEGPRIGLLRIDLRTLDLKEPTIQHIKLSDLDVESVTLIQSTNPYLWVVSASGIHRLNKTTDQWEHFRVRLKMTKNIIPASYPGKKYGNSSEKIEPLKHHYTLRKWTTVNYYSSRLDYSSNPKPFYEIEGKFWLSGIVLRGYPGDLLCRDIIMPGGQHKDCWEVLKARNEHGYAAFVKGPLKVLSKLSDGKTKIRIKSVWIPGDSAIPVLEQASTSFRRNEN